jgi:signal transduction histidine kinase
VIEVADTGVGIAPDDMDRILEPFGQVRAAASRSQPGTGLGLPLSKRLVELMAGTLEIDSRPGAGTTVRLRLPQAAETQGEAGG